MVNDFLVRTNYKTNSICSPLMRPEVYNHRSPLLCCGWLVWGKAPPPMCGLDKIRHTPQLTSRSAGQIGQTIARILKKWKSQDSKCTSYSEPSKYFIAGRFSKSEKSILQQFLGTVSLAGHFGLKELADLYVSSIHPFVEITKWQRLQFK